MLDNLKPHPIETWLKKNNWSFYDHQLKTLELSKNNFDENSIIYKTPNKS